MEIYNDTYCVYIHTNKINNKKYVGLTKHGYNPNRRWMNGIGYDGCAYFYHAIQKYGWDNFDHEIIASNLTLSEANHFEEILIKMLDTMNPSNGYNLKAGGETNVMSQATRDKMRESQTGKTISEQTRRKMSVNSKSGTKEVREKISAALTGRMLSEETKRKIGSASKGRNVGRKHTEEELEKMKAKRRSGQRKQGGAPKGVPISEETKKKIQEGSHKKQVVQKSLNGDVLRYYDSMSNASRVTGVNLGSISSCCNKRFRTAGGFIWEFVD